MSLSNMNQSEWCTASLRDGDFSSVFVLVHESRSGSTFLADLLSRHPDVSIAPESDLLKSTWAWRKRHGHREIASSQQLAELIKEVQRDDKFKSWGIELGPLIESISSRLPVSIGEVVRSVLVEYGRTRYPESRLFGLKRGGWNACHLHLIGRLIPGVRFINIVRDGRAVFASEKRAIHRNTGRPFQANAAVAAWRWRYYAKSFREAGQAGFEVRYEDLISDPVTVLSALLEFLGTNSSNDIIEGMLHPHSSSYVPEYVSDLHKNVGKAPLRNRINAWQHELEGSDIRLFEKVAGDMLVKKGYELLYSRRPWDSAYHSLINIQQQFGRRVGVQKWRKTRRRERS